MIKKIEWRTLSSEKFFQCKWFSLLKDKTKLPEGKIIDYYFIDHPGSSAIVPLNEKNEVIMVEQYRYPIKEISLEIPAGGLDKDNPVKCAKRELLEEIGIKCGKISLLGSFYASNSISNEKVYIFLAEELEFFNYKREITEKTMKIIKKPLQEAIEDIYSGKIRDGISIVALLLAERYLKKFF